MNKKIVCLVALLLFAVGTFAEAQQPGKMYRIGFLGAPSRSFFATRMEGFRQGLRDLGYIEGKNILIEYRYASASAVDKIPPGPKLDALTAEEVFGWKHVHKHEGTLVGKKQDKAVLTG
jgi:hypothetical protein